MPVAVASVYSAFRGSNQTFLLSHLKDSGAIYILYELKY